MKMLTPRRRIVTHALLVALSAAAVAPLGAQQAGGAAPVAAARLVAEPASLTLKAGQATPIKFRAFDAAGEGDPEPPRAGALGEPVGPVHRYRGHRDGGGPVEATAMTMGANNTPVTLTIPINVAWPALTRVEIAAGAGPLYAGLTQPQKLKGFHADNSERTGLTATWRTSDAGSPRSTASATSPRWRRGP